MTRRRPVARRPTARHLARRPRAAACSTWAAATARSSRTCATSAAATCAASSSLPRRSRRRSRRASRWCRPTSTRGWPATPTARSTWSCSRRRCRSSAIPRSCCARCCAWARTRSSRSRTSATGSVRGYLALKGRMPVSRVDSVLVVRHAQHPPHHAQGLPRLRRGQRRRDRARDSAVGRGVARARAAR